MASDRQRQLVEQIHASRRQLVLTVTGGGSGVIGTLLEVPGGSATLLEAVVPYSQRALEERLGGPVDQACSEPAARAMAMASFQRARELSDADPMQLAGVGATASLVSNRPKRGPHRVHVAWQSADRTVSLSCELTKGRRNRPEQEQLAAALVLAAIAEACGVETPNVPTGANESIARHEATAPDAWRDLLLGCRECLPIGEGTTKTVLFPGAFHPLHEGHRQMAQIAERKLGGPVTFELSTVNVDKPPLDYVEIRERLDALAARPVLLTRAATFVEKAELAPGCTFVVGVDTIERIGQPRYYGDSRENRDAALARLAELGCRFLVFGRQLKGQFRSLGDLSLPAELGGLCDEVPESVFRADVSSTQLRTGVPGDP